MDATRRLTPAACLAGLFLTATASAAEPAPAGGVVPAGQAATAGEVALTGALLPGDECSDGACGPSQAGRGGACAKCGRPDCPSARRASGRSASGDDGPRRWSDEWYARRSHRAIGAEQKYKAGKVWPPFARPDENADFSSHFHAAHYWPHPYNCWDRGYVKHVTALQAANGWMQTTTLYGYHFDPATNCLNDAGQLHLRWILEQAPPAYRTVYVQAAGDRAADETRLADVQSLAASVTGGEAPVSIRVATTNGRPASEVDTIRRAELRTVPDPRIEFTTIGTGTGDGM